MDARIRRLPEGLATWVGDGGEVLSGGERRLSRTGQGVVIVSHRPAPPTLCRETLDVSGRL